MSTAAENAFSNSSADATENDGIAIDCASIAKSGVWRLTAARRPSNIMSWSHRRMP